jgi:DNA-directed RNA polymerase specialized sigma24 family protein
VQPSLEFREPFDEGGQELSDSRFEELVNAHGRDVLNVALRVLGNPETAKDVYRVTVRKALELAGRRRPVPVDLDGREPESSGPDPAAALRLDDLQRRLTESLGKLPEHQADVFVLSRIEGLDHAAIAEILGCSQNSVRVSLHRALKQLAREMSDTLG